MNTTSAISALDREGALDGLETNHFDCLVIGGGITGAGIAREAARRGLSVALVEAEDFGAGTSSRSSKLIHGGLRYLAQGDVGLVRETALERKHVHRLAPHLAAPAWLVIPVRTRTSLLKFRAAVIAYEKLGAVETEARHRIWGKKELERDEPLLDRSAYPYACVYREYVTDDARLVLANLRSATLYGASVVAHARVDALLEEGGRVRGAEAVCTVSGRRVRIRARSVVNAAGPWVEAVRKLEDPDAPSVLHLSKGIHVVLSRERLPVNHPVILSAPDGRTLFAIPRGSVVYMGTTDTSYGVGPALWPGIQRSEVDYLLEPLSRYFSAGSLSPDDCVAAWAGLRPLVAQPGRKPTEISRKDEVWRGPKGVISIAGGKLTGYRKMAVGVLDYVGEDLGVSLTEPSHEDPLPGGDFPGDLETLAGDLVQGFGIDPRGARRLVELYGSEAGEVLREDTSLVVEGSPVFAGEVDWALRSEGAETLEDVLYRRMRVALYEPESCARLLEPVAQQMAKVLSWDDERRERELFATRERLREDLNFHAEGAAE